ncbi:MAG: nickel pincer cofactor biosynthesis protein LarB [bacterium]|nr:nickel pincer cofactor biosynthesis protein LarB [bacterium]
MEEKEIRKELEEVAAGHVSIEDAMKRLAALSTESLGDAHIDHHRALRTGFPEVVFCEGKTVNDVVRIISAMDERGGRLLGTRCSQEQFAAVAGVVEGLTYREKSRLFFKNLPDRDDASGRVLVISAGTSDIPVADEAAWTSRMVGCHVETLFDVGVAGIHRLTAYNDLLAWADAIIVVAGMEGALPSVVGGLVRVPVIAVPTSVGYGASFGGVAALLGMLNSCAVGVSVMNIDNGFGAGLTAARFARSVGEAVKRDRAERNV